MREQQIGYRKSRSVVTRAIPSSNDVPVLLLNHFINWIHHIGVFTTCFIKYLVVLFQTLFDMLLFQSFNMDLLQPAAEAFLALICCHQVITHFLFIYELLILSSYGAFQGFPCLWSPYSPYQSYWNDETMLKIWRNNFEWRGGRKEVSVLSHRRVTSSEVKTARFRRSVWTFLNISGCSER